MICIRINFSKTICISFFTACIFSYTKELCIVYTALVFHELAHLSTMLLLKEKCFEMRIDIFGMKLLRVPCQKPLNSFLISVSGPVSSLVFSVFTHCLNGGYYLNFFAFCNFSAFAVNLIPISPLDGGNILKAFLQSRFGIICGGRISKKISSCLRMFFSFLLLVCFMFNIFNPSLAMFIIFLVLAEKRENELILFERSFILGQKINICRNPKYFAFDSQSELLAVCEKISYSYFLIVAAFKDGRYIGDINERELLYAVRERGSLCTLEEYMSGE